jgi:purine-cytosine permease-like protein
MVLAIMGKHKLYATLTDFLAITGYWTGDSHDCDSAAGHEYNVSLGSWVSVVVVEHLYFRQGDFTRYDLRHWNVPSRLPLGGAALGASFLALSLVIPSIDQAWYAGPIGRKTGDLGLEFALVMITAVLYIPLCVLEKGWKGV